MLVHHDAEFISVPSSKPGCRLANHRACRFRCPGFQVRRAGLGPLQSGKRSASNSRWTDRQAGRSHLHNLRATCPRRAVGAR